MGYLWRYLSLCCTAALLKQFIMTSVDVIALSTVAHHSNDQQAMKKLFFKLLAMHTYNILAISKFSRNLLSR